jgi:hypothetical protein
MIRFRVEQFSDMLAEAQEIFPQHWEELAQDKDKITMAMDLDKYFAAEKMGQLHIVTVRADGKLVGYFFGVILGHLHYKDAGLMGHTDIYYILPEYRNGIGAQMFSFVEQSMKERGAKKIYLSCKAHQDHSELFKSLGYKMTDLMFTKYLGD